ncbi:glycosyltransferase [Desulfonatronovibrio magnus]|uniref:glycosyltransferase family protein n=1 Tax=Desulfonatronovibrio magnus TaxID=698827 RepID=UPI0005EBD8B4|nr:glycosyltransferase [Desulfonatronovibrio magnus]
MKIIAIHLALANELRAMGHDVLELKPPPGICLLDRHPEVKVFEPQCIIQQETLGPRIVLDGLENFSCHKVYWSIDTHLNFFWHKVYARNFDLVLTTQKSWVQKFISNSGKEAGWLPWFGRPRPWYPWSQKDIEMAFVGRITEHRQTRFWMAEFLKKNYQARVEENLSFSEMLDLYARTKYVPNESIAGEINFRLFEAASCGSLVLSQKLMEDVAELYIPEKEVVLFEHVLELQDKLNFYRCNPTLAKKIAFKGWNRTNACHLPSNRAADLLKMIAEIRRSGSSRDERKNLYLSIFELWDSSRFYLGKEKINEMIFSIPLDEEVLTAIIRLHSNSAAKLLDLIIPVLQQRQYDHDLMVNQTCSGAALHAGHFPLAVQFWKRHCLRVKVPYREPESPLQLKLIWANELARQGYRFRQGFLYDIKRHLPQAAMEWLVEAAREAPGDKEILLKIKRIVQGQVGLESTVLKILSYESLHDRRNWRWNLELAMYHLRSFRLHQGLEELILGLDNARKSGEDEIFKDMLAARDGKGYLRRCLDWGTTGN